MDRLIRFIVKNQFLLLFIVLEVFSLWILAKHSYYQQSKIEGAVRVVQGTINYRIDRSRKYFRLSETNRQLASENLALRNQMAILASKLDALERKIGDTLVDSQFEYLPARIINNSVNKQHNYLTLDVGSEHGVEQEMGVVTSQGIVGVVVGVSKNYSTAISLLNTDLKISARHKKSSHFGSLHWDGVDYRTLHLEDIPQHVNLTIGDTIVTSGYSTIFPPDILLGTIKSFHSRGANFHSIQVEMFADFKQLYNVWVVKNYHAQERDTLENREVLD